MLTRFEPLVQPHKTGVKTTRFEPMRVTRVEPVRVTRVEPVRTTRIELLDNYKVSRLKGFWFYGIILVHKIFHNNVDWRIICLERKK